MKFKDRLKTALKSPTKYGSGGYIKYAGGGDHVVFGPRHSGGGVMRDNKTELEGGGVSASGQNKPGEVITTIYDAGGRPQEFYMSHKNGIAQKYLAEKAANGGVLSQKRKQAYAVMNERANPQGHPEDIAASGGMKKYFMGGAGLGGNNDRIIGSSMDRKSGYTLGNGGRKQYPHGGPHTEDNADNEYRKIHPPLLNTEDNADNEYRQLHSSIQDNTVYTKPSYGSNMDYHMTYGDIGNNGGITPGMWESGVDNKGNILAGYNPPQQKGHYIKDYKGNSIFVPEGGSVIYEGRPKQSIADKTLDVLANPFQAFGEYGRTGELKDYFADDQSSSNAFDFVTGLVNPAAYVNAIDDLSKKIDQEGITKENAAALTLFAATKGKFKGNNSITSKLSNLNTKVNKTAVGRGYNPFSGWHGMSGTTPSTTKVTNVVSKTRSGKIKGVKGKPGNYTGKPKTTPMVETVPGVPRTGGQILKNTGKNIGNVALKTGIYSGTYAAAKGSYNYLTGNYEPVEDKEFDFSPSSKSVNILTGGNSNTPTTNTTTYNNPELETDEPVEIPNISRTDSIDYVPVGQTWTNNSGVVYKRITPGNDESAWEIVE
tara:strand:- start:24733 stop:26526 length:1794 start_codon:yes stop_codon:yes gene_type:complete